MSKKLNEIAMQTELSGSAFFKAKPAQALEPETEVRINRPRSQATNREPQTPPKTPTTLDTVTPRHHDTAVSVEGPSDDVIETIRRAVKPAGKEDATYRFTSDEKKAMADIVYKYGVAGVKTSHNEIARIGINNLLEDYRHNGAQSVLVRVLGRLNE